MVLVHGLNKMTVRLSLKVVSNEMNGGSDVVSIESYYNISQVLGLSLSFYWAVVF